MIRPSCGSSPARTCTGCPVDGGAVLTGWRLDPVVNRILLLGGSDQTPMRAKLQQNVYLYAIALGTSRENRGAKVGHAPTFVRIFAGSYLHRLPR
jgi:hypothetical protein